MCNDDVLLAQSYYIGGSRTVRGYQDNDPFGRGNKQVLASLEYRFNDNKSIFLLLADAGYATYIKNDEDEWEAKDFRDLSNYKIGKGVV